jgi:hypothetical protein
MKTGIYKKVGRRYVEIGEYDTEMMDYTPNGVTMIIKHKNCTSRRFNVDPDIVPLLAAAYYAEDAISAAVVQASEMRPQKTPITEAQRRAWQRLAKEFGDELATLNTASARDIAEAGTRALAKEAEKLLKNNSIRAAYEHFLLLCKLSTAQEELSA